MARKNSGTEKDKSSQTPSQSRKGNLVTYFVIFVFGFLSGIAFTVYKGDSGGSGGSPESTSSTVAEGQPQPQDDKTRQAIINLEAEVTANPENFQSWIRLGHLYYDSDQPEKAISAYTKSLEFHSGDANLLTDLGVMYRRIKQPEKAIELFNMAIQKDPNHQPSRFNKGIVLMYDINDPQGAIAAWEELLSLNPQAKTANGQPIREFVDQIKADLAEKK
jgi:cytochrome c-type biogenesis protein CcmH/NrfG